MDPRIIASYLSIICEYSMNWPTAELVNQWRVFPRIFSIWWLVFTDHVGTWYMALPNPTTDQAGWAGSVVLAAAAWFKFYVESGPHK